LDKDLSKTLKAPAKGIFYGYIVLAVSFFSMVVIHASLTPTAFYSTRCWIISTPRGGHFGRILPQFFL